METNFATRTFSFFLDGECLGYFPFTPTFTGNILRRGAMVVYAAPDTATTQKAGYKARFDQFRIKVVEPEECEID